MGGISCDPTWHERTQLGSLTSPTLHNNKRTTTRPQRQWLMLLSCELVTWEALVVILVVASIPLHPSVLGSLRGGFANLFVFCGIDHLRVDKFCMLAAVLHKHKRVQVPIIKTSSPPMWPTAQNTTSTNSSTDGKAEHHWTPLPAID